MMIRIVVIVMKGDADDDSRAVMMERMMMTR